MDFLDPRKKIAHQRRLLIGYFLIGIALILTAIILLLQSYGYDLDRKTGQVFQNGLIFVDSAPEKSTIYLNGKENGQTDKRITVPAGSYTVELRREGYRSWKRTFNLEGSSIERLVYPVLFPDKMTTTNRQAFDSMPVFATQSPDRRWIVIAPGPSLSSFTLFDANDPKKAAETIALPAGLLTTSAGPESLELVEWSNDNRHILVKHLHSNGAFEFVVIDRDTPASSTNLNKLLNVNPVAVTLRDKKFDQLYLHDTATGNLTFADTKTKQITPVRSNILVYKSYGQDKLLYVARDSKDAAKTVVKLKDGDKEYTLRDGLATDTFLVDMAEYDDHWYIAVAVGGKVYIYKDPQQDQSKNTKALPSLFTTLIIEQPSQLVFSANTRFILAQSGKEFAVYDAEVNRRYYYELPLAIEASTKATWMDGHRILVNTAGKVHVFDYDGINQQELVSINLGKAMFDRDYNRLYTIGPSVDDKNKGALTLSNIKLNL